MKILSSSNEGRKKRAWIQLVVILTVLGCSSEKIIYDYDHSDDRSEEEETESAEEVDTSSLSMYYYSNNEDDKGENSKGIMSDETVTTEEDAVIVEPIVEYNNYIVTSSKIYGVGTNSYIEIEGLESLFKIGDVLYYTKNIVEETTETITDEDTGEETTATTSETVVHYYSQADSIVTEIEESDFPSEPNSSFMTFESGIFSIGEYDLEGETVSMVYKVTDKGTLRTGYPQVDGACMMGNDLLYSVSIGESIRKVGVYIYPLDGNVRMLFSSGRIW